MIHVDGGAHAIALSRDEARANAAPAMAAGEDEDGTAG
jgi:hypothetical protein